MDDIGSAPSAPTSLRSEWADSTVGVESAARRVKAAVTVGELCSAIDALGDAMLASAARLQAALEVPPEATVPCQYRAGTGPARCVHTECLLVVILGELRELRAALVARGSA